MSIRFDTELCLSSHDSERLRRMIGRSNISRTLTVRLRIDPLPPSVFLELLEEGDTSQVLVFAELDEQSDDIVLVVRERAPPDASRSRKQRRMEAVTYPHLLLIALNEENGGVVIRSLPDTHLRH